MKFKILGTLEVLDASGRSVDVGGAQSRAILAMLLMAPDRVVPAESIVDRLWPDGPPASATSTLQSYISRLRRALEPDAPKNTPSRTLLWEATGYRLHVDPEAIDHVRFEQLADEGARLLRAGQPQEARNILADALALWSGSALHEFSDHAWARGFSTRLDERRLAALEDRIRADLQLGRHEVLVGELTDLVGRHELREGLWEHLAIALYRSGRQAEALRALDDLRRQLLDGLGVDPSPRIRELESQILGHDPALAAPRSTVPTAVTANPNATDDDPEERRSRHLLGMFAGEIVGRTAERRILANAIESAAAGRTQWVLIEGEPGIGKTRLLEDLAERATAVGFDVMWGRSYESGATPAFWPWLGCLRTLNDPANPLAGGLQEIIDRLLSPTGDETAIAPVDTGRYRLFEAIALLIERSTQRRPVVIALDDVQWADPASLELMEFLAGHMLGARLIIAATVRQLEIGRNDAVVQATASISRRPTAHRLVLRGVSADEMTDIVRQAVGDDATPQLIRAVHDRSEGNPFFIGELARLLAAEPDLTDAQLARRAGVPAGVRDVVHRRLGALPPATSALVQLMATIGRETQMRLLCRAAGVPMDRCIDELDPALVHRLIVDVPDAPGTVRFTHALIREVVLEDMSLLRRSRLHLDVANAIEASSRLADDDTAEILAEHLWQAVSLGVAERAARAAERAAEVALRRFAYETADDLLARALQLRQNLDEDEADLDAELDAINRLTAVRRVRFGFERARMNTPIERAKQLARKTSRDLVLAELLWTEWAGAATACDFGTSQRLVDELVDLADVSEDRLILATANAARGIQSWHLGRIDDAVHYVDLAMDYLQPWLSGTEHAVGAVGGMVENHLLTQGFQVVYRSLAGRMEPGPSALASLARSLADPYTSLTLWVCEALGALARGDTAAAVEAARAANAVELGETFEFFQSGAICLLGCALVANGQSAEGVPVIERGVAMYASVEVMTVLPFYMSFGTRAHLAVGDVTAARAWVDRATDVLSRSGEVWTQPCVMAAEAAVRHAEGAPRDEIAAQFGAAFELATSQGAHGTAARVRDQADACGISL